VQYKKHCNSHGLMKAWKMHLVLQACDYQCIREWPAFFDNPVLWQHASEICDVVSDNVINNISLSSKPAVWLLPRLFGYRPYCHLSGQSKEPARVMELAFLSCCILE
jgi:hypothetical protein